MPNRILRDGILDSKAVNSLSEQAELFYRRLMSVVDDYGRCEADADLLRVYCFPRRLESWPEERVSAALIETMSGPYPLVTVYEVLGKKFLQINNFGQRARSSSKFPPSDDGHVSDICTLARAAAPTTPPTTTTPPNTRASVDLPRRDPLTAPPGFEVWWSRYKCLRDAGRRRPCIAVWLECGCERQTDAVLRCFASYERSRDRNNGAVQNGDTWLRNVFDSGFTATWPPAEANGSRGDLPEWSPSYEKD